jgi:hypothetical protein
MSIGRVGRGGPNGKTKIAMKVSRPKSGIPSGHVTIRQLLTEHKVTAKKTRYTDLRSLRYQEKAINRKPAKQRAGKSDLQVMVKATILSSEFRPFRFGFQLTQPLLHAQLLGAQIQHIPY